MLDTVKTEPIGVRSTEVLPVDGRARARVELDLPIEYQLRCARSTAEIIGSTLVTLSSTGVLFRTDDPPPTGSELLIRIPWPANGLVHLQLQITGQAVWRRRNLIMVRIHLAEFGRRA